MSNGAVTPDGGGGCGLDPPSATSSRSSSFSPPPMYPQPPGYSIPARINGSDEDDALIGLLPSDTERERPRSVAPAYSDDVGCIVGMRGGFPVISLILTGCLAALVTVWFLGIHVPWVTDDPRHSEGLFLAIYILYVIDSLLSRTAALVWSVDRTDDDASIRIGRMLNAMPYHRWTVRSYHFDQHGHRQGVSKQEHRKIFTHTATDVYQLSGCVDVTEGNPTSSHRLCRLKIEHEIRWRDPEAEAKYEAAKASFIHDNVRDSLYDFTERSGLADFIPELLTSRTRGEMPSLVRYRVFLLCVLAGLGLIYRLVFMSLSGQRTTRVVKVVW